MSQLPSPPAFTAKHYLAVLLLVTFSSFGAIWIFSAMAKMSYMDSDYGQWLAKNEMISNCDTGDITVLGDSRASVAVEPDILLPTKVRNLAVTGSSPIEIYYEVKRILACPHHPKAFILSLSSVQYEDFPWFWLHARYGFFSFHELEEIRDTEKKLGTPTLYKGYFGNEPPSLMKNLLYASSFPAFNFASILAAHGVGRLQANERVRQETLDSHGQHLEANEKCATELGTEAFEVNFQVSQLSIVYADRLIAEAKENNVKIYILMPPISEMTADKMRPQFRNEFETFLSNLKKKYSNIELLGSAFPVMDNCSFGKKNHLNKSGADLFSRQIMPTIKLIDNELPSSK